MWLCRDNVREGGMQHDIYKLHKRLLQGRTRSQMLSEGKHSHSESMLHMLRFQ